jgi:hypothetical protein
VIHLSAFYGSYQEQITFPSLETVASAYKFTLLARSLGSISKCKAEGDNFARGSA